MARMTIIGDESMKSPGAATAEHAAEEYHFNRKFMGDWTPKPPIQRWRPDQRKRFEAELKRLEKKDRDDAKLAGEQAAARPMEPPVLLT
jgi:hypothetical protein